MKYIYLITSPSQKYYVGKSTINLKEKIKGYQKLESCVENSRLITKAIKKYKWKNMSLSILEENTDWTNEELNAREIYWISFYNSNKDGYNMTIGGDGVDSSNARNFAKQHHNKMTEEQKRIRSKNCSIGQKNRYLKQSDSNITRKKKSDSHKGVYLIKSPDGRTWKTDQGLKIFAEIYKNELKITYWQLFNAYRKCYNKKQTTVRRKDNNFWKVTRLE
jgi:hypothetical protein